MIILRITFVFGLLSIYFTIYTIYFFFYLSVVGPSKDILVLLVIE